MAMAIDCVRTPARGRLSGWWWLPRLFKPNAALDAVLAKKDDRLLADAGLTREGLLGPEQHFWRQWSRIREPWML